MDVNRKLTALAVLLGSAVTTLFLAAILNQAPTESKGRPQPVAYNLVHLDTKPNVQCPIPMSDRVKNRTGKQCVYASIETLGNWGEEPRLANLTSRPECQGLSDPYTTGHVLKRLGVNFRQSAADPEKGFQLIQEAMRDGRGVMFGVNREGQDDGHVMVMLHCDQEKVLYFDNSDPELKTQSMSLDEFYRVWDKWVLAIYPEQDPFPAKVAMQCGARVIPIRDYSGVLQDFPPDYIPMPRLGKR
jgi:hypothetical protein